jgi:hypothetical protein
MTRNRGNALIESIAALLALAPFVTGMVLLGKQLDVKHKTYDALRYSVWERTVWSGGGRNAKSSNDIAMEALDRSFGHPYAGVLPRRACVPTASRRIRSGSIGADVCYSMRRAVLIPKLRLRRAPAMRSYLHSRTAVDRYRRSRTFYNFTISTSTLEHLRRQGSPQTFVPC